MKPHHDWPLTVPANKRPKTAQLCMYIHAYVCTHTPSPLVLRHGVDNESVRIRDYLGPWTVLMSFGRRPSRRAGVRGPAGLLDDPTRPAYANRPWEGSNLKVVSIPT
jgi:hypothetical protein